MRTDNQLLSIILPLEFKDILVDALMSLEYLSGFNINLIQGYSRSHASFSNKEQVQGFRDMVQFDIVLNNQNEGDVFESLRAVCGHLKPRYWLTPIAQMGHL